MRRFATGLALTALLALAACAEPATNNETKTKNAALGGALVNGDFTPNGGGWTGVGFTLDRGCGSNSPNAFRPSLGAWAKNTLAFGFRAADVRQSIVIPQPSKVEFAITGAVRADDNRGWFSISLIDGNENKSTGQKTGTTATSPTVFKLAVTTTAPNEEVMIVLSGSGRNVWRGCYGPTLSKASLNVVASPVALTTVPEMTTSTLSPTTTTTTTTITITTTIPETTTTTIPASTTTTNPLACVISAIRTGGTGSSIPIRVTACRPMKNLQISYWLGGTRLTYSVLANVPNSTTADIDFFSVLKRYMGQPNDLPDSISLEPWFSDGTRIPAVRLPISTTPQSVSVILPPPTTTIPPTTTLPPTTTTTTPPTCTVSWDGTTLTACGSFRELRYQYLGDGGPVGGQLTGMTVYPSRSANLSSTSYAGTKAVRISIKFIDGSAISNVDLAIGATVTALFSTPPTPTTTTLPPPPGCDLKVAYGAITPACGSIRSYSYQWLNNTTTISGTMSSSGGTGWATVYLGSRMPPAEATHALVTLSFSNGQTSRNLRIPLTEGPTTIRAPY